MIPPLTGNAPTAQRQPTASAQDGLEGSPLALSRSIGKAKAQDLSWISHSDASQPQLAGITAQQLGETDGLPPFCQRSSTRRTAHRTSLGRMLTDSLTVGTGLFFGAHL